MKKITAIILALVMVLSSGFVFASDIEDNVKASQDAITLFNALIDATIKSYRFDVTKEQLLQSVIESFLNEDPEMFARLAKGAYEALDENSYYLTSEEYEERLEEVSKQFQGIGVSVSALNEKIVITQVHKNTPAIVKGLKAGDIITAVNGEDITGYNLDKTVSLIRGEAGTNVTITINRNGFISDYTLPRAVINIETVYYEDLGQNNAGYVRIDSFSTNTLNEFADALNDLVDNGVDKIILDLRYNPGGYLYAGVNVASIFVPKGKLITTQDYKDDAFDLPYYSDGDHERLKVVVLVNEYSASASEIVTGAIKEYKIGPVVGTTTFGKGTVQSSMQIKNGDAIWLTVAQYNLPSGNNIHGVGITPDYVVENTTKPVDLSGFVPVKSEKVLRYGDEGEQVLALKQYLSTVGFTFINMDNKYDDSLVQAVTAFQSATDLYPYGVADFTTQAKIIEMAGKAVEEVDNQLLKAKELIFNMK